MATTTQQFGVGTPLENAVAGTLFTWFVTAVGAALVFLVPSGLSEKAEGQLLDVSLGFGGGVMVAASMWSLLEPCIEKSQDEGGWSKSWAFVPALVGVVMGSVFVWLSDVLLPDDDVVKVMSSASGAPPPHSKRNGASAPTSATKKAKRRSSSSPSPSPIPIPSEDANGARRRLRGKASTATNDSPPPPPSSVVGDTEMTMDWAFRRSRRRILLLLVAVVLHNFPEGLAVGVQFGAVTKQEDYDAARTLAIGIGLQNFPEGLAVSLPLRRLGFSRSRAFFYGQLSGAVEPLGGALGAGAVALARPLLPYALAFAAGAMLFVVVDSVVPESHERGNGRLASWGFIVGFVFMMSLDVGLG